MALRAALEGNNAEGRRVPNAELARLLEVTAVLIPRYCDGDMVPSPARRKLIEAWSGGSVPAWWWETEKEAFDRRLLAKLRRLYPEYTPLSRKKAA